MKTEPNVFSIDDLKKVKKEPWDGVRNYQARNFMRDEMKLGDRIFIYHSRVEPIGVVGIAEVASEPYPDPSQFQADNKYFDSKSSPENPRWVLIDVGYVDHLPRVVSLKEMKETPGLEEMVVTQKGSRLSIQPVREKEWEIVLKLAGYEKN